MVDNESIAEAKAILNRAETITVITGAGISTDSGIPDFRGPNGIWTLDPDAEKITDIDHYRSSPRIRQKTWDGYVKTDWSRYKPNPGHLAIKNLFDQEKLLVCITQNIDGLHHKSGISPERVIELHGNLRELRCLDCGNNTAVVDCMDCPECDGLMKPNVVMFGEQLNHSDYHRAEMASISCDAMLVVGTTLLVWPTADLPRYAMRGDIPVIYVNGSDPPFEGMTKLIGSISEVLPRIV